MPAARSAHRSSAARCGLDRRGRRSKAALEWPSCGACRRHRACPSDLPSRCAPLSSRPRPTGCRVHSGTASRNGRQHRRTTPGRSRQAPRPSRRPLTARPQRCGTGWLRAGREVVCRLGAPMQHHHQRARRSRRCSWHIFLVRPGAGALAELARLEAARPLRLADQRSAVRCGLPGQVAPVVGQSAAQPGFLAWQTLSKDKAPRPRPAHDRPLGAIESTPGADDAHPPPTSRRGAVPLARPKLNQ